jgi:carbonic anhydrase/acetyltransferase-like protein (isoleucine patch superfamily)
MVLGSPGRVVKELGAAQIAGLEESALHYQENARRFRDQLRPLS